MVKKSLVIAFPHRPAGGGPGSFQMRFENFIKMSGHRVIYSDSDVRPDIVFVIGGTKRLLWLFKMKLKGVYIIHRLDGLSWLHKRQSFKFFLKGELGNFLIKSIHGFLADHIVYQSHFVKEWWGKSGWKKVKSSSIIYNGVDLNEFKPISNTANPVNLLCVEGTLDYSPYAISLLNTLQKELIEKSDYNSLILYGDFENISNRSKLDPNIDYRGKVAREKLPEIYKDAVYLSLDVNAACPNTVIEALSCGLPVIAYDTGALSELVKDAGLIVSFGANPWKLEKPNEQNLITAAKEIIENWSSYSKVARRVSNINYSIEKVVRSYLKLFD